MRSLSQGGVTTTLSLTMLCAGLAFVAWTELQRVPAPPTATTDEDIVDERADEKQPGEAMLAFPPPEHYREIVRRPLFNDTRAPAEALAGSDARGPSVAGNGDFGHLTLTGVVISGDKLIALIKDVRAGRVHRVHRGSHLGEWRLEAVDKESVTLRNDESERQLTLYKNDDSARSSRRGPARRSTAPARR